MRTRLVVTVLTLAGLLAGCGGEDGGIDWADTGTTAEGEAPVAAAEPGTVVEGLVSPPLAVGDRLRVVAEKSRLVAQPVDAPADAPPHWSYGRAGESLAEVRVGRAAGRAAPIVVSSWSDGGLVALDGDSGEVVWRAFMREGDRDWFPALDYRPARVTGYGGLGALGFAGPAVLLSGSDDLAGFDAATGRKLWQLTMPECGGWAPAGAHVVLDAGCPGKPVKIRVVDARTGEQTQELSPPPWPKEEAADSDSMEVLGCRPDGSDCTLVRHSDGGGSDYRTRYWTVGDDGRLAGIPAGDDRPLHGDVQPNGTDGLQVIDSPADDGRWQVVGDLRDARFPMYARWSADPLRPDDAVLWASSWSWHGGAPRLVKLDARTGRLLGCLKVPTGKTVTYLKTYDERRLVVATYTSDEAPADGAFTLVVPAPKPPRCPKGAASG
jgi:hypothetical protein